MAAKHGAGASLIGKIISIHGRCIGGSDLGRSLEIALDHPFLWWLTTFLEVVSFIPVEANLPLPQLTVFGYGYEVIRANIGVPIGLCKILVAYKNCLSFGN